MLECMTCYGKCDTPAMRPLLKKLKTFQINQRQDRYGEQLCYSDTARSKDSIGYVRGKWKKQS